MYISKIYRSLEKIQNSIIVPLIVNLIASAIAYFFTNSLLFGILFFSLSLSLIGLLYLSVYIIFYFRLSQFGIIALMPYMPKPRRPVDLLPMDERLRNITQRFLFMGVSAQTLWDSSIFEMMGNNKYRNCSFRFLLLDPEGSALLRRMTVEGERISNPAQNDVQALIGRISLIKRDAPAMDIRVRLYDIVPPFWVMLCDDLIYLQPFPKGTIGRNSSLMILKQGASNANSFYEPHLALIEEIWSYHSKEVPLDCPPAIPE